MKQPNLAKLGLETPIDMLSYNHQSSKLRSVLDGIDLVGKLGYDEAFDAYVECEKEMTQVYNRLAFERMNRL